MASDTIVVEAGWVVEVVDWHQVQEGAQTRVLVPLLLVSLEMSAYWYPEEPPFLVQVGEDGCHPPYLFLVIEYQEAASAAVAELK